MQVMVQTSQLHAFVPTPLRQELERVARANDRSLSAEVRRALAAHLEREQAERLVVAHDGREA